MDDLGRKAWPKLALYVPGPIVFAQRELADNTRNGKRGNKKWGNENVNCVEYTCVTYFSAAVVLPTYWLCVHWH